MRIARFTNENGEGLALVNPDGSMRGIYASDVRYPGSLHDILQRGEGGLEEAAKRLAAGDPVEATAITFLPPIAQPSKIICVGLNYADHSAESGYAVPDYPTVFARFASSLIGHGAPIICPRVSNQLDFEGELVAIIGTGGRDIPLGKALDHVAGYSLFNDGSIRDYQHRTPQWTVGKNFDGTGSFGPYFVSADELPAGCRGLMLTTRLNGETVQRASTDDLIFDVATLISLLSEAMTLEPGDIIVTGTPSGVGAARKPPLWMKAGDICEVEVEKIGKLINGIANQGPAGVIS